MKWGGDREFLATIPGDNPLDECPELDPENVPYLAAFVLLSPDRPVYLAGVGFIPVPSIVAYAFAEDLDVSEAIRRMRACDRIYLAHCEERRKDEQAREARRGGRGARTQRQKHR